jgi:hypothetical protein
LPRRENFEGLGAQTKALVMHSTTTMEPAATAMESTTAVEPAATAAMEPAPNAAVEATAYSTMKTSADREAMEPAAKAER